jgi:hypothetical protein
MRDTRPAGRLIEQTAATASTALRIQIEETIDAASVAINSNRAVQSTGSISLARKIHGVNVLASPEGFSLGGRSAVNEQERGKESKDARAVDGGSLRLIRCNRRVLRSPPSSSFSPAYSLRLVPPLAAALPPSFLRYPRRIGNPG